MGALSVSVTDLGVARSRDHSGALAVRVGVPLADVYLEFLGGRSPAKYGAGGRRCGLAAADAAQQRQSGDEKMFSARLSLRRPVPADVDAIFLIKVINGPAHTTLPIGSPPAMKLTSSSAMG
jgi:hypothetical protein